MTAMYGVQPPLLPSATAEAGQGIHASASEQMPTRNFDITSMFERVFCCCQTTHLELNDEEAVFRRKSCCLKAVRREPYAQLGSVEPAQLCCGVCVNVHTDQNMVCPGCGCSHDKVREVATELQNRKVKRGNIAQIRQQDKQDSIQSRIGNGAKATKHKQLTECSALSQEKCKRPSTPIRCQQKFGGTVGTAADGA